MKLDSLHTGKTISLAKVSQLLARKDDDYPDLQWTLRYCLENYIKVCIKIFCNVLVWEREEGNYKNNACGKCSEISKEREKLIDQGKDEEEQLPSYCTDCHMTSPPMMGKGDSIRVRNGIFFINREDMERLINHDSINVDRFYVIDYVESGESSQPNYKQIEVASDREWHSWSVEEAFADEDPELAKQLIKNYQNTLDSDMAYVEVKISDLYCWRDDVEKTLIITPITDVNVAHDNQVQEDNKLKAVTVDNVQNTYSENTVNLKESIQEHSHKIKENNPHWEVEEYVQSIYFKDSRKSTRDMATQILKKILSAGSAKGWSRLQWDELDLTAIAGNNHHLNTLFSKAGFKKEYYPASNAGTFSNNWNDAFKLIRDTAKKKKEQTSQVILKNMKTS